MPKTRRAIPDDCCLTIRELEKMKEGGGMLFVDCKPTCQPIERLKSMSWVHRVRLPPSSLAQRLVRYAPTLTPKDLSGLNEWEVLIYSRVSVRQVFLS